MPTGRKTKYTPETVKKLIQAIELGAYDKVACDYAGIGKTVFYEWMAEKTEFAASIKEAQGKGAISLLAVINKAARGGIWTAAAWILERRHPDLYGKQLDVTSGGKTIKLVWGIAEDGSEDNDE